MIHFDHGRKNKEPLTKASRDNSAGEIFEIRQLGPYRLSVSLESVARTSGMASIINMSLMDVISQYEVRNWIV